MSSFVLDCSMTMAWCFDDETDPRPVAVLGALSAWEAVVPSHWSLEVGNVLAGAERKKRIAGSQIPRFLGLLHALPIVVDDWTTKRAFSEVLQLARTHQLTAYDAAYVDLALRIGCPLASLDIPLNRVAVDLGIPLFDG